MNGATISPSDVLGDVLIDGDHVVAVSDAVARADSSSPAAARGGGGGGGDAEADAEEVDMEALMAEISRKLARADEALRAKAEAEKRSKIQAEALLSVYKSVTRDPETATRAIATATRVMLNAEIVAIYFIQDHQQDQKKNLRLAPHGVDTLGSDGPMEQDPEIYSSDLQVELEQGYVGRVAQDIVKSRLDRTVSATPSQVIVGSDSMRQDDPTAIWSSSGTLSPCGADAPAGFIAKSTLVSAVQYVAPSKSMVKAKSDAELCQVFTDADTDGKIYSHQPRHVLPIPIWTSLTDCLGLQVAVHYAVMRSPPLL